MTSTFDITASADLIVRYATALGYEVADRHGSGLSGSVYLQLERVVSTDADGDPDERDEIKVRISDHDLPPTYGQLNGYADIECGPHGDAAGDWLRIVEWLADRCGRPMPAPCRAVATRRARKEAARAEAIQAKIDAHNQATDERMARHRRAVAELGLEEAEAAARALSGKAKKRALYTIRRRVKLHLGEV